MGNFIGYTDRNGVCHSERLGTNGSASALMALFAVAYSSTNLPNAKRARNAVKAMDGADKANPDVKVPFRSYAAADSKTLLKLNGKNCFWATIDTSTVGTGWFASTPSCKIYEGILLPILLSQICDGEVLIPAGSAVKKVADGWNAMLPYLADSPAIERLTAMANLARGAADTCQNLHIG
jgi:hypothetical protein